MSLKINKFLTVPKIIFGTGSIEEISKEAKLLGARKVAIITDTGIVKAGITQPVYDILENHNLSPVLFQDVESDPKIEIASEATSFIKKSKADLIIGLGGGSALDIAKIAAIMFTNTDPVETYAGVNLVPKPGLPLLLIPTTAGTGSEATSISVLSDTENKRKIGIVSDFMFAKTVIMDSALTLKLPPHITASTGLDALIHAIESYVGKNATFITEPLALSSIQLVSKYLRRAYANGSDTEARTKMLEASFLAGLAFANTQTGAAHACGHSVGAMFHVPHGISTTLMLPAVMKFNSIAVPEKYCKIAQAFGEKVNNLSLYEGTQKAIDAVILLINDVAFQLGLENYGISKSDIPELTKGAIEPAARLWNNNPRFGTYEQVEEIFRLSFTN